MIIVARSGFVALPFAHFLSDTLDLAQQCDNKPPSDEELAARHSELSSKINKAIGALPASNALSFPQLINWRLVRLKTSLFIKSIHYLKLANSFAKLATLTCAAILIFHELREWQDDRAARAWQLISLESPGNSGKIAALDYLNSEYFCLPFAVELPFYGKCWKNRVPLPRIDVSSPSSNNNTYLRGVDLKFSMLQEANFSNSELHYAEFDHSTLIGANFTGSQLAGAVFDNADLRAAEFTEASSCTYIDPFNRYSYPLDGAAHTGCEISLTSARFNLTNLSKVNFTATKANGTTFINTNISNSNFSTSLFWDTVFNDVDAKETDFENSEFIKADIRSSSFRGARFFNSVFFGVNITDSNFSYTMFANSIVGRTVFSESNLSFSNFSGANLTDSKFRDVVLEGTVFDGANLSGTIFKDVVYSSFKHISWTWAYENNPPKIAPQSILDTLHLRRMSESEEEFAKRIGKEIPEYFARPIIPKVPSFIEKRLNN